MRQQHLELTVHDAMEDISGHGIASLTGLITVHSSVFRNIPLMYTLVSLQNEHGQVVAERLGKALIPVALQDERRVSFQKAILLDGQLRVQKVVGEKSILYSLKGDVVNPFNRGWLGLGLQTYHYSYSAKVDLAVAALHAYGTA